MAAVSEAAGWGFWILRSRRGRFCAHRVLKEETEVLKPDPGAVIYAVPDIIVFENDDKARHWQVVEQNHDYDARQGHQPV